MNIALIGLRGSGKSTLGRQLAKRLKRNFIDMDQELEFRKGLRIAEWVQKEGWPSFRAAEAGLLGELASGTGMVVATGGGVVLDEQSRKLLQLQLNSCYLHWPLDILVRRISGDANRPSLKPGLSIGDEVRQLYAERDPLYRECATCVVDFAGGAGTRECLALLLSRLGGDPAC